MKGRGPMGNKKKNKNKFAAAFNKPEPKNITSEESAAKTKRTVIIFVSAVLSLVLLLGAVLGTVALVKNASYALKIESTGMTVGVANYFVTLFKAAYINQLKSSGVDVSDTTAFWASPYINAQVSTSTQGDYLKLYVENNIKKILADNYLFDRYLTLSSEAKNDIAMTVREILYSRASNSRSTFDSNTEQFGFDYDDFKRAVEMMYKSSAVSNGVFGANGENLVGLNDYCDEFFMGSEDFVGYTRVKVVFIRTEDTFLLDDSGNRVTEGKTDADGKEIYVDVTRPLTDAEKAKRAEHIAVFEACIEGFEEDTVPKSTFDEEAEKVYAYGENDENGYGGYYFCSGNAFTTEFSEAFPEVVETATSLSVGQVGVVDYAKDSATEGNTNGFIGKVFIYRIENEARAYEDVTSPFFRDFYKLASYALTLRMANENMEKTEYRSKWQKIDIFSHASTLEYSIG